MRLIDADAFEAHMLHEWVKTEISNGDWTHFREMINAEPTIEERKKGKWIELDFTEAWEYRCNQCGRRSDFKENFCPNCGCEMEQTGGI